MRNEKIFWNEIVCELCYKLKNLLSNKWERKATHTSFECFMLTLKLTRMIFLRKIDDSLMNKLLNRRIKFQKKSKYLYKAFKSLYSLYIKLSKVLQEVFKSSNQKFWKLFQKLLRASFLCFSKAFYKALSKIFKSSFESFFQKKKHQNQTKCNNIFLHVFQHNAFPFNSLWPAKHSPLNYKYSAIAFTRMKSMLIIKHVHSTWNTFESVVKCNSRLVVSY